MRNARTRVRTLLALSGLLIALVPGQLLACAVCFKDPENPQTIGVNYSVLGLLAVTTCMLIAFGSFFLILKRRSRLYYSENPLVGAAFENPENRPAPEADSRS